MAAEKPVTDVPVLESFFTAAFLIPLSLVLSGKILGYAIEAEPNADSWLRVVIPFVVDMKTAGRSAVFTLAIYVLNIFLIGITSISGGQSSSSGEAIDTIQRSDNSHHSKSFSVGKMGAGAGFNSGRVGAGGYAAGERTSHVGGTKKEDREIIICAESICRSCRNYIVGSISNIGKIYIG
jgi:hypothetical protein